MIDLNADLGETVGGVPTADDEAMFAVISSASVACGGHAGDEVSMREAVARAERFRVAVGAHPSYPDLAGFGRRPMAMAPAELEAALLYQIGALAGMAAVEGGRLTHVKPHGALNNQACEDAALANVVARAVQAFDRTLILVAPALSELQAAGERAGLAVAAEVFADRAYTDAATLVPRSRPGAGSVKSCVVVALAAMLIAAEAGEAARRPSLLASTVYEPGGSLPL